MQLYVHVHVGRSLSLYHSLSSLLSCFYLPVFFSLTYTSSIMAPSGLLFQSSIMNSSSGSPRPSQNGITGSTKQNKTSKSCTQLEQLVRLYQ